MNGNEVFMWCGIGVTVVWYAYFVYSVNAYFKARREYREALRGSTDERDKP